MRITDETKLSEKRTRIRASVVCLGEQDAKVWLLKTLGRGECYIGGEQGTRACKQRSFDVSMDRMDMG